MWDQVLTHLTLGARSTPILWTGGHRRPTLFGRYWDKVRPSSSVRLLDELCQSGNLDRVFGLFDPSVLPRYVVVQQRLEWLRSGVAQGSIIAWREIPDFDGPSYADRPVPNEVLAPMFRAHARHIGMDAGAPVEPPKATAGHGPAIPVAARVPAASTGQPLENRFNESCPSHNHRSESHLTAAPAVMEWLRKRVDALIPQKQDNILGAGSGGGFLVSTTRVSELPAGTPLFRYYDAAGNAGNNGGWWTTQLVAGDPRQTLALPPSEPTWSNSAKSLCHAQLGAKITALTGVGAPRCSNKPGGPQQWFISWKDRDAGVLRLPDDISKILPKDP